MNDYRYITILFLATLFSSCTSETCKPKHEFSEQYIVEDSILVPITQEWHVRNYTLELVYCSRNEDIVRIVGIGSSSYSINGRVYRSFLNIPNQAVPNNDGNTIEGTIQTQNDSIFLDYDTRNEFGEVFVCRGSGAKQ